MKNEASRKEREFTNLKLELEDAQETNKDLESEIERLKKDMLKSSNEENDKKVNELKSAYTKVTQKFNSLVARYNTKVKQLRVVESDVSFLKNEINNEKRRSKKFEREYDNLKYLSKCKGIVTRRKRIKRHQ